jgi:hypothetical protein
VGKGLSKGQDLLHNKKLKQASCFFASSVPLKTRLAWTDSFVKSSFRNVIAKIKDSSIFLVLSQNCDIACPNDSIESAIEIAVCKKINKRDVFPGNSFVKSVRKLHFQVGELWYEANVDYILTIDKSELLDAISNIENFMPTELAKEFMISVPVWRSNRYMRSALPDNFNTQLYPILNGHLDKIEGIAKLGDDAKYSSHIRALYIWVDSEEEKQSYSFDIFALLRDGTPDLKTSKIQDAIEEMAEELSQNSGYDDQSEIYAGTESTVTVSYLTKFVRLNLDYRSLSQRDSDTGEYLI